MTIDNVKLWFNKCFFNSKIYLTLKKYNSAISIYLSRLYKHHIALAIILSYIYVYTKDLNLLKFILYICAQFLEND